MLQNTNGHFIQNCHVPAHKFTIRSELTHFCILGSLLKKNQERKQKLWSNLI